MFLVSPEDIVSVTPSTNVAALEGDNVTFAVQTDAGPDTVFTWFYDPTYTLCVNGSSHCSING